MQARVAAVGAQLLVELEHCTEPVDRAVIGCRWDQEVTRGAGGECLDGSFAGRGVDDHQVVVAGDVGEHGLEQAEG